LQILARKEAVFPSSVGMGRPLRFITGGGDLVEVTCRTIQGLFLFRPSPMFNQILIGVLARARRLHPVGISALVCLSNHFHLLLEVPDAKRLADFMQYVNCNLAREVARLTGWRHKIFATRYRAIPVSNEEAAKWNGSGTFSAMAVRRIWWPASVTGLGFIWSRRFSAASRSEATGSIAARSTPHAAGERRSRLTAMPLSRL
jgi:REP element-mobilizing transposase RayT